MLSGISDVLNTMPAIGNFAVDTRKSFINCNGFLYACDYEERYNLDIISEMKIDRNNLTPPVSF